MSPPERSSRRIQNAGAASNVNFKRFKKAVQADAAVDLSSDETSEQEEAGRGGRSQSNQPFEMGSTWPPEQVDASIQGRSDYRLSDRSGDERILANFTLLQQELQRGNPVLAGLTPFADPIIAHQLREGADDVMRRSRAHLL